jgi:hypothetical protein
LGGSREGGAIGNGEDGEYPDKDNHSNIHEITISKR